MRIKVLVLMFLSLVFLIGCGGGGNIKANDGRYYKNVGYSNCERYRIVSTGKMACYDDDGDFNGYKYAMTNQEVLMWRIDDLEYDIFMNRNR